MDSIRLKRCLHDEQSCYHCHSEIVALQEQQLSNLVTMVGSSNTQLRCIRQHNKTQTASFRVQLQLSAKKQDMHDQAAQASLTL